MVTYEQLYEFIKSHYRPSRFEERNKDAYWGKDYSTRIVLSYMKDLELYGKSCISRHEDVAGQGVSFDSVLNISVEEKIEYRHNAGNLTHLF